MSNTMIQLGVFLFITALIALLTYLKCAGHGRSSKDSNKEYFLAGGGLSWTFIAGSITLTNLSTDQLIGMNGNQMALLAWWEFAAVFGLIILAKVFLPVYYKNGCTTTTELLEKRYNDRHIRAVIGGLFLLGNIFIFLPAVLYTGSLFMQSMFGVDISLLTLAIIFAIVGSAYSIFGGLRAVAVSDTFSGVLLLTMGMLVVFLALGAIDWDFSGIPKERLTLVGDNDSPLPWHVLLTGMIFIQTFYWSTNQTITQRAMAAPSLKEAQKGVFAAAILRFMIIPPMIVIPGIVSYKLFGDVGDAAYGMIVNDVLPLWLSGAFAAAIAAAVLSTFNSILNSSAALYVCDLHENYLNSNPNVAKLSGIASLIFVIIAIALVPVYARSESIINTIQELYGLLSMPILSTFIVGLLFKNVHSKAAITAVVSGTLLYAVFVFAIDDKPFHYIHMMFITLVFSVSTSLFVNRFVLGNKAVLAYR
ncbi:SSS family solute/sodium (Na+) symporter [Catenovulum agarivorans DS-2]|uniref:SSS family solute/sodium (Na+) symporter n=1 Tax=Catenovulum agarivorans DS-2 TaxID=1328313 RepID=W7QQQ4_9ALTE|nr:SLC5 family protein [Catenovulum agarivorans]EWH10213.1 SSS family solute/sodium (Na+) symporter [Catenovulum agarivorans DS-2]